MKCKRCDNETIIERDSHGAPMSICYNCGAETIILSQHPRRVRNEAANCGNCPYGHDRRSDINWDTTALPYECRIRAMEFPGRAADYWCGEHPDLGVKCMSTKKRLRYLLAVFPWNAMRTPSA